MDVLGLNVKLLKLFMVWPKDDKFTIKHYKKAFLFFFLVYCSSYTTLVGVLRQLVVEMDDGEALVEAGIGLLDAIGFMYMKICFATKIQNFQYLVEHVRDFEEFCNKETILEVEHKVRKFSKVLCLYCLFGNAVNGIIPIIDRENCNKRRISDLLRERDPCGVMCRCYYPFDVSHELFPFVYVLQLYTCTVISMVVITLTLMQIAVFMHIIAQIQHLRLLIREVSKHLANPELVLKVKHIINYHQKIIRILNIWPQKDDNNYDIKRFLNDISLIITLMPCAIPISADFIMQIKEGASNLTTLTENCIALSCIAGMIYMFICFIRKRKLIYLLVNNLEEFKKYTDEPNLEKTDLKANLYSKLFLFYGIGGNVVYMLMPYLTMKKCLENRERQLIDDGVPCGLVTRCRFPFRFDYSPVFEIVIVHQFYTCTMVTVGILALTMLLCGLLMHITNQLTCLRQMVKALGLHGKFQVKEILHCIKYHIAIIEYSQNINEAFSSMMLFHLTFTSLVISVLGFEVIMVDNFTDSLRFGLHLFGWLVLLLLVCYYGQLLIDESVAVATDIYFIPWYEAPVSVQKDLKMILMRSQKPLKLMAANIGVMSLPTFLSVLSSAYSYFTLLLKIKS